MNTAVRGIRIVRSQEALPWRSFWPPYSSFLSGSSRSARASPRPSRASRRAASRRRRPSWPSSAWSRSARPPSATRWSRAWASPISRRRVLPRPGVREHRQCAGLPLDGHRSPTTSSHGNVVRKRVDVEVFYRPVVAWGVLVRRAQRATVHARREPHMRLQRSGRAGPARLHPDRDARRLRPPRHRHGGRAQPPDGRPAERDRHHEQGRRPGERPHRHRAHDRGDPRGRLPAGGADVPHGTGHAVPSLQLRLSPPSPPRAPRA